MLYTLSRNDQRRGQKLLAWLSLTNALGYGFTIGQVIFLLALEFGASDFQMGFFYGAHLITSALGLFVPLLLKDRETTSIWCGFWWVRAVICLSYFAIPFFVPPAFRSWALLILYYLFLAARALALPAYFPVVRALAGRGEEKPLMANVLTMGQIGLLGTQTIGFVVLSLSLLKTELLNLYLLVGIGTLFNMVTSFLIGKLPATGRIDRGKFHFRRLLTVVLSHNQLREVFIFTLLQAALTVTVSYLISFMKNAVHYSSSQIFMFTVTGIVCAMLVSNMLKRVGNYIDSRVLFFVGYIVLAACAVIWLQWPFPALGKAPLCAAGLYGLTILALAMGGTIVLQLRTSLLPKDQAVEYTVIFEFANMLGALGAIFFIKGSENLLPAAFVRQYPYTVPFFLWYILSAVVACFTLLLNPREIIRNLSSIWPGNLITLFQAFQVARTPDLVRRHLAMEGLFLKANQISRDMLIEELSSPDIGTRAACLRVLNGYPDPRAVPKVMAEAMSDDSPLQTDAITTLGFQRHPEIVPCLQSLSMREDLPHDTRATLLKTRLRHGLTVEAEEFVSLYPLLPSRRSKLDFFIALVLQGDAALLFHFLEEELNRRPSPYWSQTLFVLCGEFFECR
ncbi:MAG: HEAT repeat domain-containing protein, partial [Lentisphaerae bacterium]